MPLQSYYGKSLAYEYDLLNLILNGVTFTGLGLSGGISTLYVSLHTANPTTVAGSGTLGTQNASEAQYGGYARAAIPRNPLSPFWSISVNGIANPSATITFPQCTSGGSEAEAYFAIGVASSGPGEMFYWGPISPSLTIVLSGIPQISTATAIQED
jgi:hypothetical protein